MEKKLKKYISDIDAAYVNATSYNDLFDRLDNAAKDIEPHECFELWEQGKIKLHYYDTDNGVDGFEIPV